jgi:thymidylate kinase
MLISFSGLDGAGKSTLIAWLQAHLEQQGVRVAVFHMNDHIGIHAYARMLRDAVLRGRNRLHARSKTNGRPAAKHSANGNTPEAAARRDARSSTPTGRWQSTAKRIHDAIVWNHALRTALYPLDLLIFLLYRAWFERVRQRVVIMDRYFYDTLVDLSASRSARTLRLLQRLTPTPALAVLLDISPEESFARKGEYSVPYLRRRHVAYHQVLPRVSTHLVVHNDDFTTTRCVLSMALRQRSDAAAQAAVAEHTRSDDRAARPGSTHATASAGEALAAFTLRALLDRDEPPSPGPADWPALTRLAADNGVLLRLHDRFHEAAVRLPGTFSLTVAAEQTRARAVLAAVGNVERALDDAGIDAVFPKAFTHYPDIGSDIDLLVDARHREAVAAVLARALGAVPQPVHLHHRIAGSATFYIPGCPALLDVHHGRLGPAGEQTAFAEHLLRRSVRVRVGDTGVHRTTYLEDRLVLQGQERVYGRRTLRLSDLVFTIPLLRIPTLDWDYVLWTSQRTAALGGLSCYLAYVEQIHDRLFGAELLPPRIRTALRLSGWGRVTFRGGQFAFPAVTVGARLTLEKLACALRARSWHSAARVCLLPLLTLASAPLRSRATGQPALALDTVYCIPE